MNRNRLEIDDVQIMIEAEISVLYIDQHLKQGSKYLTPKRHEDGKEHSSRVVEQIRQFGE